MESPEGDLKMQETTALGAIAALGSAASWAIGAFLFKSLGERLSPLAMTLAKGVCSLLLLGAAVLLIGAAPLDYQSMALLALSGVIGIAFGDTFFFRALQGLAPQALLVLMVLGQILTIGLAVIFLQEQLPLIAVIGIPMVLAGVVIVLRATSNEGGTTRLDGVIFGLLSVTCMAVSVVIAKKGLGPQSDTIQATFVRMLSGTAGVFAYGIVTRQVNGWITPFRDRKLASRFVLAVGVVAFGGFWLGIVAVKYCSVAIASTLTSTEPAFGLVIAAAILRERVSRMAVIGTAITFVGVVVLSVPDIAIWFRQRIA
jgi:drug/metabolite transporter (DMT)-like permease